MHAARGIHFESGAIVEYGLERHKIRGLKPAVDFPLFAE